MEMYLGIALYKAGEQTRLSFEMSDVEGAGGRGSLFRVSKTLDIKPLEEPEDLNSWMPAAITAIADEIMHATYTTRIVPDVQWRKEPPASAS